MDNASKALLIAGAVLLVIAIIAVAMGIFGTVRGVVDNAEGQVDAMSVKIHNQQFTEYDGEVTGAQVKDCVSKALANNSSVTESAYAVSVQIAGTTYVARAIGSTGGRQDAVNNISTSVQSNFIYTGVTTIGTNGIITGITFTKIN